MARFRYNKGDDLIFRARPRHVPRSPDQLAGATSLPYESRRRKLPQISPFLQSASFYSPHCCMHLVGAETDLKFRHQAQKRAQARPCSPDASVPLGPGPWTVRWPPELPKIQASGRADLTALAPKLTWQSSLHFPQVCVWTLLIRSGEGCPSSALLRQGRLGSQSSGLGLRHPHVGLSRTCFGN